MRFLNANGSPLPQMFLVMLCLGLMFSGGEIAQPAVASQVADADPAPPPVDPNEPATEEPEPEESDDPPLPRREEMELPSKEAFLTLPARDWLVLVGDKVLEVEPVYPRPGKLDAIKAAMKNGIVNPETRPLPGDDSETRSRKKRMRDALAYLELRLLEGDERDFRLHSKFIKEIVYFEDLLLQRVDLLLDAEQTIDALDLLVALNQRQSDWPGGQARLLRLMAVEAELKIRAGEYEPALVQLEQLHTLDPAYRGLSAQLAFAGEKLMTIALEAGDYRQVRHFLSRLRVRIPAQKVVPEWTERLKTLAAQQLAVAITAESQGDWPTATSAIRTSSRIWPAASELPENFRRIMLEFPSLEVGVTEFSVDRSSGHARKRFRNWLQTPVFQVDRLDGSVIRYSSPLFAAWEPTPLSKSVLFRLKPSWTANQMLETLGRRLEPASGDYDERLAYAVSSIRYRSPTLFEVAFRHPPLIPEALLRFPIEASTGNENLDPLDGSHFELDDRTENRARYHRVPWNPNRSGDRSVAEIIERKYPTDEKAIQGLLRGEVSLLPQVPARLVGPLQGHPDLFVNEYAIPVTHLLRFRFDHPALANKAFRLALVHSLRREQILENVLLYEPAGKRGRVSSSPMPTASYGSNTAIRPHPYDIRLAISLLVAARKELGGTLPQLKLAVPSEPLLQTAAESIIADWKRIGIDVVLTSDAGPWDIRYETVALAEPLTDIWPCLAGTDTARVEDLAPLPPWLRQSLVSLEDAGDWDTATRQLKVLHQQIWADVTLLPLWEVAEFLVVRRTVRGLSPRPFEPYQRHAEWRVQPWFAKEPM